MFGAMMKARNDMPLPLYDETRWQNSPGMRRATAGVGMLAVLLVMAPGVGERDRPEWRAEGLLRGIMTAQQLHFANHGSYDTLQCLASAACIGPVPPGGAYQGLLAADVAALKDYYGYKLSFYPGPRASAPGKTPWATPLSGYAVVLVPTPAVKPNARAFCADSSGSVYMTQGSRLPRVLDGRCLETSNPVH